MYFSMYGLESMKGPPDQNTKGIDCWWKENEGYDVCGNKPDNNS